MDSSLPVLVSRVPDRRALARIVAMALRHDVAEVELAMLPPRLAQAYTLDLHVEGLAPIPLYAELVGAPQGLRFPLRIRPLYRAQIAQLNTFLDQQEMSVESVPAGHEWISDLKGTLPVGNRLGSPNAVIARAMAGAAPPPVLVTQPVPMRAQLDDLKKTSPLHSFAKAAPAFDPRRTAPSATWAAAVRETPIVVEQAEVEDHSVPVDFEEAPVPPTIDDDNGISVVFEPEVVAALLGAESIPKTDPEHEEEFSPPTRPEDVDAPQTVMGRAPSMIPSTQSMDSPLVPLGRLPLFEDEGADENDRTIVGAFDPDSAFPPETPHKSGATGHRQSMRPHSMRPKSNVPDSSVPIGREIGGGKYVIEALIGSGAAGSVFQAKHKELRKTVAIKLLHPHYQNDPHFMATFRGEALAASQLDHPNVMRVLDFGQESDGLVYIVMEFLSGRTLQSLLDEQQRLPAERAVDVMVQVCAALSVAHDHGIIHRDIKPDNIMLVSSRNDEGATFELVKVCDFGIAARQNPADREPDAEDVIAGTPEYMSPEQVRGTAVDARSDVYACGICLYELMTGIPPFLGQNAAEILIKQLEDLPRPPTELVRDIDPILEEIILRAIEKDPARRHQSAREMRVELKELIEPESFDEQDDDERSIVESVPVLDDPASGFAGFFVAFASAVLKLGRFERGHAESVQAQKELNKAQRVALRAREEITFARRTAGFVVMTGTAEIAELKRLLGAQMYGSFGEPFVELLVKRGIASITFREGLPDAELHHLIEALSGLHIDEELAAKPLRSVSVLFERDILGSERKLAWKVELCISRIARDLRMLAMIKGLSLKKVREGRDSLVGGVARLLTRGDEVRQFLFNADLVDESVRDVRGFSSFKVAAPLIDRLRNDSCAETALLLMAEADAGVTDPAVVSPVLERMAERLVNERSPKSDAAVAELHRRNYIADDALPRDLKEAIRAQNLADTLTRDPGQFMAALDRIGDLVTYDSEVATLEIAMATLARRSEAVPLLGIMATLARHAKGTGPREALALRAMKSLINKQQLVPIATTLLIGPTHQREAARQLLVLAGSVGAEALLAARQTVIDPAARPTFVRVFRETGPAGYTLLSSTLTLIEVRDDAEVALVEDLLRAVPERPDTFLGETVSKFLSHPRLRAPALMALVPLWGERARKPLIEALEYAEEPTRIIALAELRRMRAIDEQVFTVLERFLTMRGSAGEELRAAAAGVLADAAPAIRPRVIALLSKTVEGKRGLLGMLRGDAGDESIVVLEAMARSLIALDRAEGQRALKARIGRSEGTLRARLAAVLQNS